jgi:zinc transport system substrate-binding protein
MSRLRLVLAMALVLPACRAEAGGEGTVVASFYPLAYAVERIAGPGWQVIDLTPPGNEAHDVEVSLEDRTAIEEANVVVYMGDIGFQPQVEAAVTEADGEVVAIEGPRAAQVGSDPHLWLSPTWYLTRVANLLYGSFADIDPGDEDGYEARFRALARDLKRLDRRFGTQLRDCRYRTIIVSHEAFAFLTHSYQLTQFGLSGLTPEGEPTVDRIRRALHLIEDDEAGAVFYEPTEEGLRVAESIAGDAGVPALPLSTLESQPPEGDYLSVMEENLESLREGLQCR